LAHGLAGACLPYTIPWGSTLIRYFSVFPMPIAHQSVPEFGFLFVRNDLRFDKRSLDTFDRYSSKSNLDNTPNVYKPYINQKGKKRLITVYKHFIHMSHNKKHLPNLNRLWHVKYFFRVALRLSTALLVVATYLLCPIVRVKQMAMRQVIQPMMHLISHAKWSGWFQVTGRIMTGRKWRFLKLNHITFMCQGDPIGTPTTTFPVLILLGAVPVLLGLHALGAGACRQHTI
jgi:hypothetical protein